MTTTDDFNARFDATRILLANAADAFDTFERMTKCDCPDTLPRNRSCIHFDFSSALRDLLIDRNTTANDDTRMPDFDPPAYLYDFIRNLLAAIDAAPYQTQKLSMLALSHSLCPMHFLDYAICFDDDDDECASIRAYFPDHDT